MTTGKRTTLIAMTTLLVAATTNATAQIYKWVDANGVTHYSDSPRTAPVEPEQVDDQLPPLHTMQRPDPALNRALREAQPMAPPQRKQRAAASPRNYPCARWQAQLKRIQSQLRKGYREPRGNRLREQRRMLSAQLTAHCR